MPWFLVPDGRVWVFYWRSTGMSSEWQLCELNVLLKSEVRGDGANWLEMTERPQKRKKIRHSKVCRIPSLNGQDGEPWADGLQQQKTTLNYTIRECNNIAWFNESQFTGHRRPSQSLNLNPIEHLRAVVKQEMCITDVQLTNLQQHHEAIMLIRTRISGTFPAAPCWIYAVKI